MRAFINTPKQILAELVKHEELDHIMGRTDFQSRINDMSAAYDYVELTNEINWWLFRLGLRSRSTDYAAMASHLELVANMADNQTNPKAGAYIRNCAKVFKAAADRKAELEAEKAGF